MNVTARRRWASLDLPKGIAAPLVTGAALRLCLASAAFLLTGTRAVTQGDTASYLEPGRNLLLHGLFRIGATAEIDRTPGYPLFAMLTGMAAGQVWMTVAAQIAVSLASVLLVSRIARMVYRAPKAAIAGAWLFALEPVSIVYCARLMPETLFVLLLLVSVERLVSFQTNGKSQRLIVAGIALAAATYVRPVSYYLVLPLAAALAFGAPGNSSRRSKAPVLLLAVVAPCLAAWQIRNYVETGYGGFSSVAEKNLYFYQSAEIGAETGHISLIAQQKALGYPDEASYFAAHPEQRTWTQVRRIDFMRSQAANILARHPWLALRAQLAGAGVVAFTPCAAEWLQLLGLYPEQTAMPGRVLDEGIAGSVRRIVSQHRAAAAIMAVLELDLMALYALAAVGCFRGGGSRWARMTLSGIAVYFLLISGGAQAVGRYRLPAMAEICVFASAGWVAVQGRRKLDVVSAEAGSRP